jgi:hypothetical protein
VQSFPKRFFIYQKERFPVLVHVPLIIAFSFSAIGFSRACRGLIDFIDWRDFLACLFTNITLFFLLRVSDEHKDKEEDAAYRSYLPVPRGLVTLTELRIVAIILFAIATVINIIYYTSLLPLYALMMLYLLVMRYEFFAAAWLKKHMVWYIVSHMVIIPLADIYASAFDWQLEGAQPSVGLLFFFGVSYLNGVVLEIGRKMRVSETEEPGVVSYTKLWGLRRAPVIWSLVLLFNFLLAWQAAVYAGYGSTAFVVLIILFIVSVLPAFLFLRHPSRSKTKWIELMSLVWALGMYLTLGGIPLLLQLLT